MSELEFPVEEESKETPEQLGFYALDLLEQRENLNLEFGFLRRVERVRKQRAETVSDLTDLVARINPKAVPPHFNTLTGAERPAVLPEIANDNLPIFMAGDRQGIAWTRNVFVVNGIKEAQTGHDANADNILATDVSATDVIAFGYAFDGTDWDRLRTLSDNADNATAGNPGHLATVAKLMAFDGTTFDRLRTVALDADNITALAAGALATGAHLLAYDGSTYDRATLGDNTASILPTSTKGLDTRSILYGFNGVSYSRLVTKSDASDASATDTLYQLGTVARLTGYNGATWDRLRTDGNNADAEAVKTLGVLCSVAHNTAFNGTTWDRIRCAGNDADNVAVSTLGIQNNNAFLLAYDGTTYDRLRTTDDSSVTITPGASGVLGVAARQLQHNNTSNVYEHVDGNYESTLLSSSARTASVNSSDQNNRSLRGVVVMVNITAWTAGSITVEIQGKDPISGTYYPILTSAALAAVAFTTLRVYPGLVAVANLTANDFLPRTWRVSVTAATGDSITYSIGNSVIV